MLNEKEYPKEALAISYEGSEWPLQEKNGDTSAVSKFMVIKDVDGNREMKILPVYSSEYCQSQQQFEVRVMDGTHIRTKIKIIYCQ